MAAHDDVEAALAVYREGAARLPSESRSVTDTYVVNALTALGKIGDRELTAGWGTGQEKQLGGWGRGKRLSDEHVDLQQVHAYIAGVLPPDDTTTAHASCPHCGKPITLSLQR